MRANPSKLQPDNDHHNACAQCGETLFAPTWSERAGERRVRYLWSCTACGYQFETTVYLSPLKTPAIFETAA
ncbi:MAG TPA: hypothetical protein VKT73_14480 [Xanthobacteraceae bacterium]|nr:hypothetical protein [Xanthobacteraceae bacterium]